MLGAGTRPANNASSSGTGKLVLVTSQHPPPKNTDPIIPGGLSPEEEDHHGLVPHKIVAPRHPPPKNRKLTGSDGARLEFSEGGNEVAANAPRQLELGIRVDEFYDIAVAQGTFTLKVFITSMWRDTDDVKFLNDGENDHRFTSDDIAQEYWRPNLHVSNTDFGGEDTKWINVNFTRSGQVTAHMAVTARCKGSFSFEAFPFDHHILQVKIVSKEKDMREMRLKPLDAATGIPRGQHPKGFHVYGHSMSVVEQDGFEYGILSIKVKRNSRFWLFANLGTALLLLHVGWLVFWFPLELPFAMPRVATSMLSMLSIVTAKLAVANVTGGISWGDRIYESFLCLLVLSTTSNVFIMFVAFRIKKKVLALRLDDEMKFIYLFCALFTVAWFTCVHSREKQLIARLITGGLCLTWLVVGQYRAYTETDDDEKEAEHMHHHH